MCYKMYSLPLIPLSRICFREYGAKLKLMFFNSKKNFMKLSLRPEISTFRCSFHF